MAALILSTSQALALFAGTQGLFCARGGADLQHRLSAESFLLALPALRADAADEGRGREVEAYALELGNVQVNCEILPVHPAMRVRAGSDLEAGRLVELARSAGLPAENVALRPIAPAHEESIQAKYLWFDQLVMSTEFEEIFRLTPFDSARDLKPRAWSDLVSFWAEGTAIAVNFTTRIETDLRRWFAVVTFGRDQVVVHYLGML